MDDSSLAGPGSDAGSPHDAGSSAWSSRSSDFELQRVLATAGRGLFGEQGGELVTIGRYRITRRLGAGGMGEVYLGFDPQLERSVAIKLVHAYLHQQRSSERLRREARALARLSHPNVVQVYEVGEHDGRTYLAMELVEGGTLRQWLAQPRPWRQVLERFIDAARGLAAAHEAGVIHRDFKPDNVLVTSDGRVRVTDFGLALTSEQEMVTARGGESEEHGMGRLTRAGAVMGTVHYMPLEQLEGAPVDARADQFAFCAALYEALYGRAPFDGDTVMARRLALGHGDPAAPPSGRAPRRLWKIIRRGLAREPSERWPDMVALSEALEAVPRRRRRRAISGLVLAGALPLVALALDPDAAPSCEQFAGALDEVWNEPRQEQLRLRFESTGLPYAEDSLRRATEGIDRWAERWLAQRVDLCEAVIEHEAPEQVLGLRGACLDQHRQELVATVEMLLSADDRVVTRSSDLGTGLPQPEQCRDDETLVLGMTPPPVERAESVSDARQSIAVARVQRLAGHPMQARSMAAAAVAEADASQYRPAIAEARTELGRALLELEETTEGISLLEGAVDLAEASHHDRLAAEIWTVLTTCAAIRLHDGTRGAAWLRRAEAAQERVGVEATTRSRLVFLGGVIAALATDHGDAERSFREALALLEGQEGDIAVRMRPSYLDHLADAVAAQGREGEALELRRAALVAAERGLGPEHPNVAVYAFALGQALLAADRRDDAIAMLERAAALWSSGPERPDPRLGSSLLALGQAALEAGRLDDAHRHARGAEALLVRSLPDGHAQRGNGHMLRGLVELARGEHGEALAAFDRAAETFAEGYGPDDPSAAYARFNAGVALLELERLDEARARFEAALGAREPGVHSVAARLGLATVAARTEPAAAEPHLVALASMAEGFGEGERLEYELLAGVVALRLQHSPRPLGASLHDALHDAEHPQHARVRLALAQLRVTEDEQRQLLLPDNPHLPRNPDR